MACSYRLRGNTFLCLGSISVYLFCSSTFIHDHRFQYFRLHGNGDKTVALHWRPGAPTSRDSREGPRLALELVLLCLFALSE